MRQKIKVGIVSYLNAKPLLYGLRNSPFRLKIELVEDNPARLANMLIHDEIDIGLVPVAILKKLPNHSIVGDYCIAADGEVASVCLFSEVPLSQIERVFLDYQSETSVALLIWIMKEYWGISPDIILSKGEEYRHLISGRTAGLVIGDRAFEQRKISTFYYDLALEWKKITGLPFVFACWASKRTFDSEFIDEFNQANKMGLDNLETVLRENPYKLFDLNIYYNMNIKYELNLSMKQGLNRFLEYIG